MVQSKRFHLANVLSVTTGFLFPEPGTEYPIDGVYNILNFMTRDDLYTHALPRAAEECRPLLFEQLPFTRDIDIEFMRGVEDAAKWTALLDELVAKHGAFHEVYPIGADDHEVVDPIDELLRMKPDAEIIPIVIEDEVNPMGDINWKLE